MSVLKAIEVNEKPLGSYWACYVYRRNGETEYSDEDCGLYRENCIEPKTSKVDVLSEARRIAQANNVSLINLIDLNSGVPFVETLAMMNKEGK